MTWTECDGIHTATAQGLELILEAAPWSIWSLDQAKASAAYLVAQKASGLNPWVTGSQVRLFYRPE